MNDASAFRFGRFHIPADQQSRLAFAVGELELLHVRRRRMPDGRKSDARWSILLDLYVAAASGEAIQTGQLGLIAGVGGTTLIRYLEDLEKDGLITRTVNERDNRVTLVEATDKGRSCIEAILDEAFGQGLRRAEAS